MSDFNCDLQSKFCALILAGGVGTRLWPRSRRATPKQFSDVLGLGKTMIQATVERLYPLVAPESIYVITGQRYVALAAQQLAQLPSENILAEPSGRNTAPAIGLGALWLRRCRPDSIMAVLPADHVIRDAAAFRSALEVAVHLAEQDYLVTLGITPTSAHTGYGYIRRSTALPAVDGTIPYVVDAFVEKPDAESARCFVDSGNYYWNGGIFVARTQTMLNEIQRHLPDLGRALEVIEQALGTEQESEVVATVWPGTPKISIDYGVMERAERVVVVPLDAGWNDVGGWSALADVLEGDREGNIVTHTDHVGIDTHDTIVMGNGRLIATVGLQDVVIVDTDDVLLICHRALTEKVRAITEQLEAQGRDDVL